MELIEHLEIKLAVFAGLLKLILEAIAVLCVFLGLVTTIKLVITQVSRSRTERFHLLRLKFGSWLVLALEFQLGADIVGTSIAPSFEMLGQLAIIALIRTFLSYFLNKEIEEEIKQLAEIKARTIK